MSVYFFRSEPGAAELRRLARRESGRVCQRALMIANMLEGMEHEEAARLAGLSRSAAYDRQRAAAAAPISDKAIDRCSLEHQQISRAWLSIERPPRETFPGSDRS